MVDTIQSQIKNPTKSIEEMSFESYTILLHLNVTYQVDTNARERELMNLNQILRFLKIFEANMHLHP